MTMNIKTCGDCENDYPKTSEYFYTNGKTKNGEIILKSVCRTCHLKNNHRRKQKRIEEGREKKRYYPKILTDEQKLKMREYYNSNKERILNYGKEYNMKNPERRKILNQRSYEKRKQMLKEKREKEKQKENTEGDIE